MSVNLADYDAARSVGSDGPSLQRKVGILSIAAYFPKTYVDQADLEIYDKVDPGKYTKGLMQDKMAFCTDLEDINSISMTVTQKLLEQAGVSPNQIGYLEVGTETLVDKSKSVKTVLMDLFAASGNHDIEGVDTTNACYGGTAALFHAIDHCQAPYWDGRLAIVVAADIAVYDKGNARPTGGCGAIALLIGPNAPLVFDPIRGSFMTHTYDFYKPDPLSEYPTVDGKLSLQAYVTAVDKCYEVYRRKYTKQMSSSPSDINQSQKVSSLMENFDAILFHSPYCKLVRKAFARFLFDEYVAADPKNKESLDRYKGFQEIPKEEISVDYDNWAKPIGKSSLEKVAIQYSEQLYQEKTGPSLYLSNQIGNMYTASLYSCLVAYLTSKPIDQLVNKNILLFSYGSGSAASMFSARLQDNSQGIEKLVSGIKDVRTLLEQRIKKSPEEFTAHLEHRKRTFSLPNRSPTGQPVESHSEAVSQVTLENYLFPGTYYLNSIDHMFRRRYSKYETVESNNNNNDIHCVVSKKHPIINEDVQSKPVTAI